MNSKYNYMKRIKEYGGRSIFVRNLSIVISLAMIPVLIMSVFFYKTTIKSVHDEMKSANDNYLGSIAAVADATIRNTEIFTIQTSIHNTVSNFAFTSLEDNNMHSIQTDVKEYIKNYIYIYDYIHSIYIYNEKSNLIIENQVTQSFDEHMDKGWYEDYLITPVRTTKIINRKWNNKYPPIISIIRPIGDEYGKLGCVVVNIDFSKIIKSTQNLVKSKDNILVLIDKNGEIIYSDSGAEQINSKLYEDSKSQNIVIDDVEYLVSSHKSDIYEWQYFLMSSNAYIRELSLDQFRYTIGILIALILAVIISSLAISLHSYKPIRRILSAIDTTEEVNRIETAHTEGDEISYIVKQFREKESLNEELESELKLRMLLLNKAQTYALQAQINPHFLNNVMETVNWMSVDLIGEGNKVSDIVRPLSQLLNISADTENYVISVEEELRHVNIYTYIASIIYGDKINFSWNVNPDIMQYKILKFTLQPLIENAISHGIKPKRRKGSIVVEGDFFEDGIRFTVSDDGVGIDEDILEMIKNELNDENIHKKTHLGINNVNQRIKLVFGSKYGLNVDNAKPNGTIIEIFIPKVL